MIDDKKFLSDRSLWGQDYCCLKKRGGKEFGFIPRDMEPLTVVLASIYDFLESRDIYHFETYATVDDLLAAGWIVD